MSLITKATCYLSLVPTAYFVARAQSNAWVGVFWLLCCWIILAALVMSFRYRIAFPRVISERDSQWQSFVEALKNELKEVVTTHKPGFVYLMRRADGVYKIGCTDNIKKRRIEHKVEYRQEFEVVKKWLVPDKAKYEKKALRMTRKLRHKEGQRRELRQMTSDDVVHFIATFEGAIQRGMA